MFKKILSYEDVITDIESNRNRSWYEEIYYRNKNNLNDVALLYRGTKITYGQMFNLMNNYAKSLKSFGIKKGDEIPICISNCPELVYILGAISIVGAKANIFGSEFDKDYILEIVNDCNSNLMFIEDNFYLEIKNSIDASNKENIIVTNLSNSLKNKLDPYEEIDKEYIDFNDKTQLLKEDNSKIIGIDEFSLIGKNITENYFEKSSLDDEFTITYSSGSTNSHRPKAIVHNVRSFITIGRYHDKEVSGSSSMKNFVIEAHIPTHSNTDIISSISDTLMQGAKLALEPIYDKDFFINSLLINKPNYIVATTSFWINTMKKIFHDDKYKNVRMPFLLIPFAVGEPLSIGEEKFLNKGLRKVKAGKDLLKLPFSPITMCVAGGDCEHGGIFWTLFRQTQSQIHNRQEGLGYFNMVEVACLDKNGDKCVPNEYGMLVANSPCTMKKYKNNPKATSEFFVVDSDGKTWANLNVYGYIDDYNKVFIKGRILDKNIDIPPFVIADCISKDTKNILSCEVVETYVENKVNYVAHIEVQPTSKKSIQEIIDSATCRCVEKLGFDISQILYFRVHSYYESFELTGCGKRNNLKLRQEGISKKCIKASYNVKNEISKEKIKVKK